MAFTIDQAKEMVAGYLLLLLVKFTFSNGNTLYVSTRDVEWDSHAYSGRVADADLERVQMMSESGVDIPPSMSFHLADPDGFIYQNYERGSGRGFRGAKVEARIAFYDVLGNQFSTDSIVRYMGVCDPAVPIDDTNLEIRSTHRLNASKRMLPQFLIGPHCPKIRPLTASQCAQASDEDSDFYPCGITDTSKPDCNNTRAGCIAADNLPRFAGITYQPPRDGGKGKEYTSGNWVQLFNSSNDAKYGEPWPMVLGRGWVECPVLVVKQDGNYTRCEVGLCVDAIDTGYSATVGTRVIVNGYELPPGGYDSPGGFQSLNPGNIGWWNWLTRGHRDGLSVAGVAARNEGKADPYGSLATIEVVIPRQVASGEQVPQVSVLFSGPQIRVYSDSSTYSNSWTDNPAWHLLWLAIESNWHYDELDIQSFIDAAGVCAAIVPYTSQYGGTLTHARYKCNLILRKRQQAGELIRGVRQTMNAMLQPNRETGKLAVSVMGTLAAQQPSAVSGSNYNTPVSSVLRNGSSTNGYVAYRFNEDNTISVRGIPRPISDTPNRISFQFQDSENNFSPTSLALAESDDVERVGQEVSTTEQFEGCANYDQAMRLGKMRHKETHRGNPQGDTRGTQWFEVQTSIRALRVYIGHIVSLSWAKLGLTDQLFRVMSTAGPTREGVITLTVRWHQDQWYVDANNQRPDPSYSNPRRDKELRASYPPCPDIEAPAAGDPLFAATDKTFGLQPEWTIGPEGNWIGRMKVISKLGVNEPGDVQAPQVQPQANVSGGGFVPAGTYYVCVAAKDSAGKLSFLSLPSAAILTATGTITVPIVWWDPPTTGYVVYAGHTPFRLTKQAEGSGKPTSVSVTAYSECTSGAPDQELDALVVMGKLVHHSGIVGTSVAAVAANSITIGGEGWTVNALTNYEVSLIADLAGDIPIRNYRITANTANGVLTVTPNPASALSAGNVVIVRSKPTISNSGKTFADALWANPFNGGSGLNPDEETGKVARIISGKGAGLTNLVASATSTSHTMATEWLVEPDSTSRIIIEEPEWLPLDAPYRPISNWNPDQQITLSFPIENYSKKTMLVGLKTMDGSENSCVEPMIKVREVYLYGQPPGVKTVTDDYTMEPGDHTLLADASAGSFTIQLLPSALVQGQDRIIKRVDNVTANVVTVLAADGEDIDGNPSVDLLEQNASLHIVSAA